MATIATSGPLPGEARPAFGEAERLAAEALARQLREMGREAAVQPFWVRPYWWLSQVICCALGVAASVLTVRTPLAGLILAFVSLVLALADETRLAPLRRLTPARAGQNVVSRPLRDPPPGGVYLVLTAAIDDRRPARSARLARSLILANALALGLVALCAAIRLAGFSGLLLDVAQLLPTLFLLVLVLALLDRGTSSPAADHSAGEAVLELTSRLDARPPGRLAVAVVLAGGGDAHAAGLRHWLATRRRRGMSPTETAVLAIEPCREGTPVWWKRDGTVVATGLHPQLRAAAARASEENPRLEAGSVSGPDATAAGVARGARWPALAIGARDSESPVPGHSSEAANPEGDPEESEAPLEAGPGGVPGVVELGEALVRELERELSVQADESAGQSSSSSPSSSP